METWTISDDYYLRLKNDKTYPIEMSDPLTKNSRRNLYRKLFLVRATLLHANPYQHKIFGTREKHTEFLNQQYDKTIQEFLDAQTEEKVTFYKAIKDFRLSAKKKWCTT